MINFLIHRPIAIIMTFIAFLLLGGVAAGLLPVSLMPDIDIPEISVQVNRSGISVRELENTVVRPLRQSLSQVAHLEDIKSETRKVNAVIPLSFIGVFITFTLFKFPFDQGGYASMVLLCGLTVNSALYIINDYNQKKLKTRLRARAYLKAYHHKIVPILLTILSTALGLIPFLINGQEEGFWFSLAVGAIGGLMFSVLAIVVWMPVFMKLRNKDITHA